MEIHPKFAHWLSLAKITPGDETIRKWWSAIDTFVPAREDIVNLVTLAKELDPSLVRDTKFLKAIQTADASFLPSYSIGLAVLAATKLYVLIDADADQVSDFATLLTAVSISTLEKHPAHLLDLASLAESKISDWSRDRAEWDLLVDHDAEDVEIEQLRKLVAVTAEESNLLWWLFGRHSKDTKQPLSELSTAGLPLIVGKELADLTTILPGPVGIIAFADRALSDAAKSSAGTVVLEQTVKALPSSWIDSFIKAWGTPAFGHLCRVSQAIAASKDVAATKWPAVFSKTTGWTKGQKLEANQLANLFYRERLTVRAWELAKP